MKVIVALDQSECSDLALQSVLNRKWPEKSQFKIISVFEPLATMCVGWEAAYMPISMIDAERTLFADRKQYIEKIANDAKAQLAGHDVIGEVLKGYAWNTIVDIANAWNADLIVLGSHGKSGLTKFFLGSVAEAVASHAKCSVEIIKGHPLVDPDVVSAQAKNRATAGTLAKP